MRYMKEILLKNKKLVLSYLVIGIAIAFLENFKADYFQKIVDGLTDHTLGLGSLILYGAVLIGYYSLNYLDEYPGKKLEHGIFLDFKLISLHKIERMDYQEYQSLGTGKLVQRIENGAEAGKGILFDYYFCLFRQLLPTVCFSVFFIWRINRRITYVILIGYVLIFIITNLLLKVLYQLKEKILSNEEKMNHYLVRGFMELVVFRLERQFKNEERKASRAKKEIVDAKVKMNLIHEAFFTIFALMVAVLEIGILIYAWKSQAVSVGSVVALVTLINNAYTPIAIFNVLFVQYKLDRAAFSRFEEFLDQKEDVQLECGKKITALQGGIEVRDLAFRYGERTIFEHLNLSVRPGEKVALVGESGSGKSTFVKMLAGLLKYETGSIRLDGQEEKELCLNGLYENLSYLSQDSPIFDGTVRENLVFERDIPEETLVEALEKVQLSSLYETMEHGLDTMLGEHGKMLSGGEKQRLALARLWFERHQITILDEATSAMDNLTEEAVMGEILELLKDKTVIAIAHRLSSIRNFDKIVVCHEGKIVGTGTFDQLMEKNAYFQELYQASFRQEEN